MRLGERSARGRLGRWGQLILSAVWLAATAAHADSTSAGPGRIVCNATFCELSVTGLTHPRIRVIVSGLPQPEIARLRKCTGVAKPCVVTVEGSTIDRPTRIMATALHWQE